MNEDKKIIMRIVFIGPRGLIKKVTFSLDSFSYLYKNWDSSLVVVGKMTIITNI